MGKPNALSWRLDHSNSLSDNKNIILLCPELLAICAFEGLEPTRAKYATLAKVHKGNYSRDQEEPITKVVLELQKSSNKAVHSLEWSNVDGLLYFRGKIYVPWTLDLCRRIVALCHNTKIAGHPGQWKMLELVSCNY